MRWQRAERRARRGELDWLRKEYAAPSAQRNFGVAIRARPIPRRDAREICSHLLAAARGKNTVLWSALFKVWPDWHWGFQGTGDCVGWGTAHMGDLNLAIAYLAGKIRKPDALICQESIYGFGKSELFNSYGYHGAGMSGVDATEAWKKYGTLYRLKYPGHDLTEYSGSRSVAWGERPRATHGVLDELEPAAAEHKAIAEVGVTDAASGAALLEAGYAWQYCGYTYWPTRRTRDGMGASFTSGWHCMTCVGVIYGEDGRPAYWRIANTGHGDHCDGPAEPGDVPQVYQECGGWVPTRLVEPVLRAGDCRCVSVVDGWQNLNLPDSGEGAWL